MVLVHRLTLVVGPWIALACNARNDLLGFAHFHTLTMLRRATKSTLRSETLLHRGSVRS